MARGIKIYTVPTDYATLELVTSTGNPQYRDIVVVKPSTYNDKVAIYQYLYNTNNVLVPSLSTSLPITFTDNTIIPNVTVARKAHQDDYRSLINALLVLMADKYGDTYYGTHNFENAKIKWDTIASKYALYIDKTTDALNFDYSYEFKLNTIGTDYSVLANAIRATLTNIYINLPTNITQTLTVSLDGSSDQTIITNSLITVNNLAADDAIVSETLVASTADINTLNAIKSDNANIVTGFNADKLDGYHAQEIITMIPKLVYNPAPYEMRQYDTVTAGSPTKTYVTDLILGQRINITLDGVTYSTPGIVSTDTLEFCRCTCTCTCTCPCTCTAPCSPCTNTGMWC
jgi:hypothetical protein